MLFVKFCDKRLSLKADSQATDGHSNVKQLAGLMWCLLGSKHMGVMQ